MEGEEERGGRRGSKEWREKRRDGEREKRGKRGREIDKNKFIFSNYLQKMFNSF